MIYLFFSCPDKDIMSPFKYNRISGTAEAQLYSMFKFPESNRVHFQCDILVCRGRTLFLMISIDTDKEVTLKKTKGNLNFSLQNRSLHRRRL